MDIRTEIELAKLQLKEKQNKFHAAATDEERSIAVKELKVAEVKLRGLLKKEKRDK